MKKLSFLVVLALVGAMVWTLPALAAPKALTETEMDSVTAAGQPEVLIAASFGATGGISAAGPVTLLGTLTYIFAPATSAQQELRALVVNNVIGENAVATGLNIQAAGGASAGGSQTNVITQSWGSTVDTGVGPSVPAGNGGTVNVTKCVFSTCTANGGAGALGQRLSIYSDEILIGSTVYKQPTKNFEIDLAQSAQSSLAALALNNVAGINLTATGINILAATVNVVPGTGGNASVLGSTGDIHGTQTNTINQFRGTPFSRPQ